MKMSVDDDWYRNYERQLKANYGPIVPQPSKRQQIRKVAKGVGNWWVRLPRNRKIIIIVAGSYLLTILFFLIRGIFKGSFVGFYVYVGVTAVLAIAGFIGYKILIKRYGGIT